MLIGPLNAESVVPLRRGPARAASSLLAWAAPGIVGFHQMGAAIFWGCEQSAARKAFVIVIKLGTDCVERPNEFGTAVR